MSSHPIHRFLDWWAEGFDRERMRQGDPRSQYGLALANALESIRAWRKLSAEDAFEAMNKADEFGDFAMVCFDEWNLKRNGGG